MALIDKDQIRAEIERLKKYAQSAKKEWIDEGYNQNAFAEDCRIVSFDHLLFFIDTLPEQPVTNCNWLVSEINKKLGHDDWLEVVFDRRTLIDFAGHFYALGLNARKDE